MKHAIATAFLLTLLCAAAQPAHAQEKQAPRRPNILFIFSDDHASHAISAYGSKINQTSNIDRLAKEGMLFRNCFVTNSICTPSRATILTGKFSHLNGAYNVSDPFDATQQSYPALMQAAGYQTAMIGKWHLGHGGKCDPVGFDHWSVLIGQGPYYNPPMIEKGQKTKHIGYTTDIITDLTLKWLKEQRDPDKPFMLMSHHKASHRNWVPGPPHMKAFAGVQIPEPPDLFDDWQDRSSAARLQEMTIAEHLNENDLALVPPQNLTADQLRAWHDAFDEENEAFHAANLTGADRTRWMYQRYIKNYLRCVASIDDSVGRLLDYLEEEGLADNTIVIYSSDQGFYLGDHGWYDKRFMYEQSLRMPLLVRWPGVIEPGLEDEHLVQNLDFAQTLLHAAGIDPPADMQGRSLVELMKGQRPTDWRDAIYYHYYDHPAVHNVHRHFGVRTDRYKLIHYYQLGEWELFDLEKDPRELRSLHDDPAYAQVRKALEQKLGELQQQYGDANPTQDPPTAKKRS
jgi:arylsulfatase A-like enzyme